MPDAEDGSRSLLDPSILRTLFRQLEQTDVDELEIVTESSRLYLRREPGRRSVLQAVTQDLETPAGLPIVAPLTGIYYSRATPGDPPYASVGDLVEAGQVVALIETMKIFNEIKSEITGEVIEVAVTDGDLVETGAPLLFVQPQLGGSA